MECNYAIVDIETTGFSPAKRDKIVEIAILILNANGDMIERYETLINPNRDIGATHVHGITADMVKNAPFIEDILPDIINKLKNKIIVAHNFSFEKRFLEYEINKSSQEKITLPGVCTMQLARELFPEVSSKKLEVLCDYFDINNKHAHSALGDTKATAYLFNILKAEYRLRNGANSFKIKDKPFFIDYNTQGTGDIITREDADCFINEDKYRLSKMLKRLPVNSDYSDAVQEYIDIIDKILLDRIVTIEEAEMLIEFAKEKCISEKQAYELHEEYLRKLIRIYLFDGIISNAEYEDLSIVATLLGISNDKIDILINYEKAGIQKEKTTGLNAEDYKDKTICFTGELQAFIDGVRIDRKKAHDLATEKGMICKSGVIKSLDFLVVADPYTMSGKAKKAKEYGIPIIADIVFWNMLGVKID